VRIEVFRLVTHGISAVLVLSGCGRSLEGAPCPCVNGYVCCAYSNTCRLPGACSDDTASAAGADAGLGVSSAAIPLPEYCSADGWCGATVDYASVSGSSPDDIWIVAHHVQDDAASVGLLHYDGQSWTTFHPAEPYDVTSVFSLGPNDAWATGGAQGLMHWDGSSWTTWTGTGYGPAVWASAPNDIWVFGTAGQHFDGSRWQSFPVDGSPTLRAAWGSAPNDVWAVGDAGALAHYDGSTLARYGALGGNVTTADLRAVWGSGHDDVWAVGGDATVLHWDGKSWQSAGDVPTSADLAAVWGDADTVWIAGSDGTLLRRSEGSWVAAPIGGRPLHGVWSAPGAGVWTVGDRGTVAHFDGSSWGWLPKALAWSDLVGVWGAAQDDVLALGEDSQSAHYDGRGWSALDTWPSNFYSGPSAVWGTSAKDIWALSADTINHFDGSYWQTTRYEVTLHGVWASAPNDAWAVGDAPMGGNGTILHFDGSAWQPVASGVTENLAAVWGSAANDVWIASAGEKLLHYDGSSFTSLEVAASDLETQPGSWERITGTSADDIWLFGGYGWGGYNAGGFRRVARHFDGRTWSAAMTIDPLQSSSNGGDLAPLFVATGVDVYGACPNPAPAIIHFDGTNWSGEHTAVAFDANSDALGNPPGLLGIGGTGRELWAVGTQGVILHKRR
jgi:hypothetical protein